MEELLYQYNPWWEEEYNADDLIPRTNYFTKLKSSLENRSIIFLTGLRRVGKTSLMKLLISYLIENKTKSSHILYISLDDYTLRDKLLEDILIEYRRIHKLSLSEQIYIFFDEVTYKEDYQQQLKNIYDKQTVKIYATS